MAEVFDGRLTEAELLDIGAAPVQRPTDPIDGLFGDEQSDNLFARWTTIASEYGIPIMAYFHAMDSETMTTTRAPVDQHNIEKGRIAVKLNQSERMRALERSGLRREDQQFREAIITDAILLAQQVVTRTKIAKNELLSTGKVTIKENNLQLTVDFGVAAEQSAFTIDLSRGVDVAAQIQTVIDAAADKGVTITGMVCGRKVLSALRSNTTLQKVINGTVDYGALIRRAALDSWFSEEMGIQQILTNDLQYAIDDGTDPATGRPKRRMKRYFPEDKISFFATNPAGRVGAGLWGIPGEADLGQFGARVNTSGENPFVYITQYAENDPPILWTKASALFMPVLYMPDSLWIASTTSISAIDPLTVTSAAGTASGTTALTVSPAKTAQTNVYKYKTASAAAPVVAPAQNVTNWTTWNGSAAITARTGDYITVVEADSTGKALKAGSTPITAKA